ncbi:sft2-domain-containing protein [Stemphylium lycopersici]|nr:sft2-domain-containing protein [Stemphylium lycopersici]
MASASFRDSMNSLGWSRREAEAPVTTAPPSFLGRIQGLNPFGQGGYVRLPTTETNPGAPLPAPTRREEEEGWFAHRPRSNRQCDDKGVPALPSDMQDAFPLSCHESRRSALTNTRIQHLVSGPRLPFTAAYFGSIALTLVFSLGLHSTILTFVAAIAQLVALLWYIVSYFPMGSSGLRFAARFGGNRVAAWMND